MYTLETPLSLVAGIGPKLSELLNKRQLFTVKDLLLYGPLRYEDRSIFVTIEDLLTQSADNLVTIKAMVVSKKNYYKGRRSIQSATIADDTGKLKLMWFNNRFIIDKLVIDKEFLFSGKLNDRQMMVQAVVEDVKNDTVHTGRLIPLYSSISGIKQGSLRRILKHLIESVSIPDDKVAEVTPDSIQLLAALQQLHFPDSEPSIIQARQRLALEELLSLIKKSQQMRDQWNKNKSATAIELVEPQVPTTVPFTLTAAQLKVTAEILNDLQSRIPMNRLMVGDVGSGKTVVAGIACNQVMQRGLSAAIVAPTRILADQHTQTLAKLFPDLKIELITSGSKKIDSADKKPVLYIGTHAVINRLAQIEPGLIIFDEQHRFGVVHRSSPDQFSDTHHFPHVLTMSATPIPRTLMLTIFSHLHLSVIDEMPQGRLPIKTWVVPDKKRADAYTWITQELGDGQALVICPFIDPSNTQALENIAAVTEKFEEVKLAFPKQRVATLHGRMSKKDQQEISQKLYDRQIDILVTTPIVEVGVDLPAASIIVIEAAERFGLASLHQLRGRVGRAGQQAYCLLFSSSRGAEAQERLQQFSHIHNGRELAEVDLAHRGAGNIFGTEQHGFDDLQFANWANLELISHARTVFEQLKSTPDWQLLFDQPLEASLKKMLPLAN